MLFCTLNYAEDIKRPCKCNFRIPQQNLSAEGLEGVVVIKANMLRIAKVGQKSFTD